LLASLSARTVAFQWRAEPTATVVKICT